MWIAARVIQPSLRDFRVFHQFLALFLPVGNAQLLLLNERIKLLEKLLLICLEDFPRRIGDDHIKTAARLDDLVELIAPTAASPDRFSLCVIIRRCLVPLDAVVD